MGYVIGGEVDGISVGSTAKAIIIGVVQHHTGVVVGVERTAHHAMAVGSHAVHLSHLPNGDGGLDSLIQAQGHSSFVSCVAPEYPKVGTLVLFALCLNIRGILQKEQKSGKTATEKEKALTGCRAATARAERKPYIEQNGRAYYNEEKAQKGGSITWHRNICPHHPTSVLRT